MSTTPTRYTFQRDRAAAILPLIEEADETGDWGRVNKVLTPHQCSIAGEVGLANFEPTEELEHNSQVNNLLYLAWDAGWVTGPFEPIYEHEDYDANVQFRTDVGEHPATLRLVTPWQEIGDLIGSDEMPDGEWVNNTGTEAAVDFLDAMVDSLNAVLTELDNYVAAQVAPYRDFVSHVAGWCLSGEKPPAELAATLEELDDDQLDSDGNYDMSNDAACEAVHEFVTDARAIVGNPPHVETVEG